MTLFKHTIFIQEDMVHLRRWKTAVLSNNTLIGIFAELPTLKWWGIQNGWEWKKGLKSEWKGIADGTWVLIEYKSLRVKEGRKQKMRDSAYETKEPWAFRGRLESPAWLISSSTNYSLMTNSGDYFTRLRHFHSCFWNAIRDCGI